MLMRQLQFQGLDHRTGLEISLRHSRSQKSIAIEFGLSYPGLDCWDVFSTTHEES